MTSSASAATTTAEQTSRRWVAGGGSRASHDRDDQEPRDDREPRDQEVRGVMRHDQRVDQGEDDVEDGREQHRGQTQAPRRRVVAQPELPLERRVREVERRPAAALAVLVDAPIACAAVDQRAQRRRPPGAMRRSPAVFTLRRLPAGPSSEPPAQLAAAQPVPRPMLAHPHLVDARSAVDRAVALRGPDEVVTRPAAHRVAPVARVDEVRSARRRSGDRAAGCCSPRGPSRPR